MRFIRGLTPPARLRIAASRQENYEEGAGQLEEYLLPPDLFVERLDRALLERVVAQMLSEGEMKPEWLCPPDEKTAEPDPAPDRVGM